MQICVSIINYSLKISNLINTHRSRSSKVLSLVHLSRGRGIGNLFSSFASVELSEMSQSEEAEVTEVATWVVSDSSALPIEDGDPWSFKLNLGFDVGDGDDVIGCVPSSVMRFNAVEAAVLGWLVNPLWRRWRLRLILSIAPARKLSWTTPDPVPLPSRLLNLKTIGNVKESGVGVDFV